ncbi:Replication factor C subunit 3 [Capsicum chinense]|nr:Replication factor C subunit 3 [Capsicum chinense]
MQVDNPHRMDSSGVSRVRVERSFPTNQSVLSHSRGPLGTPSFAYYSQQGSGHSPGPVYGVERFPNSFQSQVRGPYGGYHGISRRCVPPFLFKMLWVDKYRPKTLDKVIVHQDVAQNLQKLVSEGDCPHLLFYGPSGSGKKTLIMALLRQIFGPSADKVKVENKVWKVDAGTRTIDVELTTLSSTHHVELNPSDAGFQDRYVVQEIIKEMAKNRPIDTKGKKGFKVLVLNEVDKLSREAQHSLRRTMEKYSASCRLVLCSNSSSKVTEAVRSRCLNVRINAPMEEEIVNVLEFIAKKEGLQSPQGFAARIAEKSNRNLRRAVLTFETCRVQQYPFTNNQAIPPMDWEQYVSEIASDIMKEQSPKRLFEVRGKLYELLTNCIPPEIILKRLLFELLKKLDSELKHEVSNWAAHYEHRMRLGQKAIFHLEGVGESSMKWIVNHEVSGSNSPEEKY